VWAWRVDGVGGTREKELGWLLVVVVVAVVDLACLYIYLFNYFMLAFGTWRANMIS